METFQRFTELPLELQREIWRFALHDKASAVCVFRANGELMPRTVDVEIPSPLHVCRESRSVAQSLLEFRSTSNGAYMCPYREFCPDRDTLFVPEQWAADFCDPDFLETWTQRGQIRRLALDEFLLAEEDFVRVFANVLSSYLGGLEILSLVFANGVQRNRRRFRLENFGPDERVWASPPGRVVRKDILPTEIVSQYYMILSREIHAIFPTTYGRPGDLPFKLIPQKVVINTIQETRSASYVWSFARSLFNR
ncbi:hypothetical protein JX265_005338 [Neoarthrinium moseri]|uniref:2EXR domain-containing protein n=1 Tax=Neoarthrinium moseri TaxID=1658444 RepID=A0A9P9WNN8_9PEZI|nr:hypothetical protein JX265_005338 [Neoarthrinium moseri]